jgi:hypothetical protein
MHSITMAIRSLTHRSMLSRGMGYAAGMIGRMGMGMRRSVLGAGARRSSLTQAQSDARMSQALRALQGINMHLTSSGAGTSGRAQASGHVQHAIQELGIALSIR